ncbi:hypothetical protein RchiOBHm_Chr5g0041071 [Rosa chinensis]|uniref:Uncharacterized protein n=1 Tax=Rosa chinensis TaxID=74649 RepID=A0A2P6QCR4_ROSCH|nr:hypothetical protein RchiOBHm_Chr5g0041071 [Rosa chinensis]
MIGVDQAGASMKVPVIMAIEESSTRWRPLLGWKGPVLELCENGWVAAGGVHGFEARRGNGGEDVRSAGFPHQIWVVVALRR